MNYYVSILLAFTFMGCNIESAKSVETDTNKSVVTQDQNISTESNNSQNANDTNKTNAPVDEETNSSTGANKDSDEIQGDLPPSIPNDIFQR